MKLDRQGVIMDIIKTQNIETQNQLMEALAQRGIKSTQAGTALRSILTRLAKPPKEAAAAMDKYDISMKNSDGSTKSLMEVMENMRDSLRGLPKDEKAAAAAALGGQEAMSGLLAIVNASDTDFKKLASSIKNADGASEKMANTMNDNLILTLWIFLQNILQNFNALVRSAIINE